MVIPWFHKNLNTNNTPLLRCLLSFRTFHKPYQVLELIHCTEYLSPECRNSHFWKLKIRHHESSIYVRNTIYKFRRNFIKNCLSYSNLKMNLKTMSENGIGWVTCKRQ